jgi:hypothetical protein
MTTTIAAMNRIVFVKQAVDGQIPFGLDAFECIGLARFSIHGNIIIELFGGSGFFTSLNCVPQEFTVVSRRVKGFGTV